ncbi:MAG: DUF2953 domain-containing protein [Clostridia bacterium]|nr:DUF2953 domain-containing protein [Clostridia bacterium]
MIVLKIIGWIILAIIALIVFVLCIKVRIFAEYSEIDTRVRIQWLFLKIPLFPSEKKNDGKKKKKDKNEKTKTDNIPENATADDLTETSSEEPATQLPADETLSEETPCAQASAETEGAPAPKQKNNLLKTLYDAHGIDGLLLIVQRTFSYIGTFFGDLAKSLVIDELYLDVRCTKKDAASTAIYYGEVCSALFPMLGAMVSKYKVKKYDINVYPDYLARQSSASFAVSMHLYPIYLIGITLLFGCRMLFKVLLRLIVKIFLPKKKENAENSNNAGNKAPVTQN